MLLEGFFDRYPDFKFVIRTGMLYNRDEFQAQVKEKFPLMTRRGRVRFEMSLAVDRYLD